MEFFRIRRDIPFMRHVVALNLVSFLTFAAAVFFIATRGLSLSIEFTGGTVLEVEYSQAADLNKVRATVDSLQLGEVQVQAFGSSRDVLLRLPLREGVSQTTLVSDVMSSLCRAEGGAVTAPAAAALAADVAQQASAPRCLRPDGTEPLKLNRNEFVGPSVGAELAQDGAIALLFTVIGIVIYLALRFEWKFAVAGVIANLHDVVIILGFFAFFQWEFSLAVLAAVLAVLGYSVNESVVIFDRIRETFRRMRKMSTSEAIDHAITRTISRTVITHGSTQVMVLSMLLFGGATLYHFALALTIGILFGIYSSIFVAAGIALRLGVKREDLVKPGGGRGERDPNDPNAGAVV
jgi:preprotein translocase subunit SecF